MNCRGRGSSKLYRGALKAKRPYSSLPPQPPNQLSLDISTSRNTLPGDTTARAPMLSEESFSLVSGGDPKLSMIIKLAPGMVEEIKRLEAQGGRTRMKFASNPYNRDENIIDVGGKQFRFTWSQEFGDLCDIYEERQSGKDGNGLLVESGCAWRKLNVQRTLDESTKNHVKMRSEEAERKLKSRKAIVLEPGNPSVKALAAAEATLHKSYNKMKEAAPPKKSKVETLQVAGPPKSTYVPGFSTTTATMSTGRHSSSFSFPLVQPTASSSPLGAINISKGIDNVVPSQNIGKQTGSPDKEILTKRNNATRNVEESKGKNVAEPTDLRSILVSLLMSKPGGMTFKALEKAVNGIVPDPKKKMEPIMRKIASYKSPGKYILLPGMDLESFEKPSTKRGSSTGDNHPQQSVQQEFFNESPASQGGLKENNTNDDLEELVQLNSKLGQLSNIPTKDSEGQEGNTIGGGSDSESGGRGDNGSGSMSIAERENGSGSDGENGASSRSEEVPCEDVDAVTNYDERESKNKTEASAKRVFSLIPGNLPDGRSLQYETREEQHNNESDALETGKNLPAEPELKEVADRGQCSGATDKNNNCKDWIKYFSDENASYLKYEKAEAELKGPIMSLSQYQEYVHQFREKHDTYMYLNKACASYEVVFQELVNNLNDAKDDEDMYNSIFGKVMESYETYGMKHKRQKKIYIVLHRELEIIDVGGKQFRFTWSPEFGDLCDIYEEHQSGEDGTTATMNTDRPSSSHSFPLGAVKICKGIEDDVPSQKVGKQDTNTCGSNKEILTVTNNAMSNIQESKGKNIAETLNLQSILISLLMNKPDGMTLKALEKAVKGLLPNLKKKINPIVRKIASYKYGSTHILLPGVDLERFKKSLTESGSFPDDNHPQLSDHQEFRDETQAPKGVIKYHVTENGLEELVQLNSKLGQLSKTSENIHDQCYSPDILNEKKGLDLSEGQEGNASERGSDSDSESGSRGHSESRSRSTVERGSGSDSENGASFNSEEYKTCGKQHNNESGAVETEENSYERLSECKHERDSSKNICERVEFIKRPKVEYSGQAQCSLGMGVQMFGTTCSFSPIHASGKVSENPGDDSNRNKQSLSMGSYCLKEGEVIERLKDARPGTHYVHCDSNPGEFLVTKLFKQKNSSEATLESRKPFSALVSSRFPSNLESTNKKITNIIFQETTRSHATPANASSPSSFKEVADRGQSSGVADKNNNDKNRRKYFSDENASYLKYEKAESELKGPIMSLSQYKEYFTEFSEKYNSCLYLNKARPSYKDMFQELVNGLNDAKDDKNMYGTFVEKLMESYVTYRTTGQKNAGLLDPALLICLLL
ncbi:unnamed protein product [Lupinus luteus]|uniref:OCEL domain-containing protein n=1 Tax=Lupinus luteus TaxID=3873 RepID=A0AAV1YL33_LUPLU